MGEWLPEPLLADPEADPARHAEVADTLSLAFLVLLESLSPEQRAVFLLREVFDYPYDRIAEIVGKSEPNVRQLAVRARRHVEERRVRFDASREQREQLADRFFAAAQEGDLPALEALLAEDVELHGDGGGKVPALARALFGRSRVARTLRNWMRAGARMATWRCAGSTSTASPERMLLDGEGRVFGVMALDIADGQVQGIRSIVNPDKLGHLGEVADVGARCCAGKPAPGRHSSSMLCAIARRAPITVPCSASLSPSKISRWRAFTQVRFSSSTARPLRVSATVTRRRSSSSLRSRSTNPRVSSARSARVAVGTATRAVARDLAHRERLVGHGIHHEVLRQCELGLAAGHAAAAGLQNGADELLERVAEQLMGLTVPVPR